jgi:hypothetical protein
MVIRSSGTMGLNRDINGMIMELVWLQANVDYLQEFSIILATNKSKNNDITDVIIGGGDN